MKNKTIIIAVLVLIIISAVIGVIYYKNREKSEEAKIEMSNSSSKNTTQNYIDRNENSNIASSKNTNFNFETKTVKLNSGYEMPLNGIGTYSLTGDTCYNAITSALNSGVRLIDTAYMYGNEEEIGRAIKDSDVPREEIFVITKIYPTQFDNPEEAIEMAFDKLGLEYIDMMLLHHPGTNDVKAYKAMEKYAKEGKIHSLGLSN